MWALSKQFIELNKILTTDQCFCCGVLLVKIEVLAVTAWERAVHHLPADSQPTRRLAAPPALPAGQQCRGDQRGTVSLGRSAEPALVLPHPSCDADVIRARSFMRYNICLGSQHAAVG